ncbi:MAG: NAD(P)-binding protein, partial [Gaiellaceae bacterium]
MSAYPHLFSPLQIGSITVRNRIMQTAHVKLFAYNAVDSQRNVAYQAARAKGGAGLLITGNRVVHPTSTTGFPRVAWAYLPEALDADRKLTDAVHEHGAAIFAQLNHFGLNASSDSADDYRVLWGPSAVKSPAYGETAKAMEVEDIREVVDWWGRSAELTREGGFDGTEVHISHSYLLHQFLSPLYNKRTDEYGGAFENRLRFAREVIEEVRRRAGRDWVVGVRISLTDFIPGALDVDDAVRVAQALEADGDIDYVNVTAAGYHNIFRAIEPSDVPDGYLVDLTAQVKAGVALPVFTVGGIKDPALAEEILSSGKADMVAMTRAQIADPEFANKVREGGDDEVYHCIRGNQGCIARVFKGLPITCTVNPAAGREQRFGEDTLE